MADVLTDAPAIETVDPDDLWWYPDVADYRNPLDHLRAFWERNCQTSGCYLPWADSESLLCAHHHHKWVDDLMAMAGTAPVAARQPVVHG